MTDSSSDLPDEGPDPNTASMFGDAPASAPSGGGYQVLARKYRPNTFEDMVGQEVMVRTLTNAFRTGRIAHAFMLTGVRGVGKTTTARLLARALNYASPEADEPSIRLSPPGEHCKAIMESRHPDVLELDAASRTGVSDMRELLDGVRYRPAMARYKIYIIDEVHMLSTAAFNALLKTLEEPPPHVKFIFATTEIRKVPVTVLSRCQRFNLPRLSTGALAAHLGRICKNEGATVAEDGLALIARAAEGSARDALSILDQAIVQSEGGEVSAEAVRDMLGLADRSRTYDLLEHALAGRRKEALAETQEQLRAGAEGQVLIKDLLDMVTEISRAQAMGEDYAFAGPADWRRRTEAMAGSVSPAQASRYWKLLLQGFEDCGRSPDPGVCVEMTVLRLAAAASLPSPEDAARMLAGSGPGPEGGGGATNAGGGQREPAGRPSGASRPDGGGRTQASAALALAPVGQPLSSLPQICAALQADKQINLLYDIERFIRPAAIDFGVFKFAPLEGIPADFAMRLKNWLEDRTNVEWIVDEAQSDKRSIAEIRERKEAERMAEVSAHPRIASFLAAFPEAEIVKIEGLDEDEDGNVIRVDFSRRPDFDAFDDDEFDEE